MTIDSTMTIYKLYERYSEITDILQKVAILIFYENASDFNNFY